MFPIVESTRVSTGTSVEYVLVERVRDRLTTTNKQN